jgi:diguanylate cyclase (GGDEF)-like protein
VLKLFAGILAERCRETDMVARYGGEEFLLCFPQASTAVADRRPASKIRVAMESADWQLVIPGGGDSRSAPGLARDAGRGCQPPGAYWPRLTAALYEAKSAGRNQRARTLVGLESAGGTAHDSDPAASDNRAPAARTAGHNAHRAP